MLAWPRADDDGDDDEDRRAGRVQGTTGINSSLLTSAFHGNTRQKVKFSKVGKRKKDMNGLLVAFQL